eukprot:TRINITY_DN15266_c0_g1_i1.p1 TRINITY_DN15266_c0_g1~~TRINITY_DN15266_c0_g1_i1.p1  ORF type:complete len:111 (+),score=17.59 TRINITY_DN15266_c0_g1_i1:70-402(+)
MSSRPSEDSPLDEETCCFNKSAAHIYSLFIHPGSVMQVNVPYGQEKDVFDEITSCIGDTDNPIDWEIFEDHAMFQEQIPCSECLNRSEGTKWEKRISIKPFEQASKESTN